MQGIAICTAAAALSALACAAAGVTAIALGCNAYLLNQPLPAAPLKAAAAVAAAAAFVGVGFAQLRQNFFGYEDLLPERLSQGWALKTLPMKVVSAGLLLWFLALAGVKSLVTLPLRLLSGGAKPTGQ